MSNGLVIGPVPAMHFRPKTGRKPYRVDAETALMLQEAAQEELDVGSGVTSAYRVAFRQIGVRCENIQFVFWARRALQTVAEPRRALLQDDPFPAIFSFIEKGVLEHVHPSSVFAGAVHYVSSQDRKSVEQVRWGNLPF